MAPPSQTLFTSWLLEPVLCWGSGTVQVDTSTTSQRAGGVSLVATPTPGWLAITELHTGTGNHRIIAPQGQGQGGASEVPGVLIHHLKGCSFWGPGKCSVGPFNLAPVVSPFPHPRPGSVSIKP